MKNLTPEQVQAWAGVAQLLDRAGIAGVAQVKALIRDFHKDATDEDLNAVIESVIQDAVRRKAIADREAAG